MRSLYLDHNATTPLLPEAWEAMRPVAEAAVGNPSSAHHAGRKARQFLEDARDRVAAALGAHPDEVFFTSGATEANNLALFGLTAGASPPAHVLAAPFEHPCVIEPLKQLAARHFDVDWLPVTPRGQVETAAVMARVRDDTRLVCLMLVNHETGALQPVRHVAKKLPKQIPLHCDAAQAIGKIPVHFRDLSVTTLTASAHKFRGPTGVGLLLAKRGATIRPLMFGGHQQKGTRPGTEPVALAVGLAVALEHAVRNLDVTRAHLEALGRRFLAGLGAALGQAFGVNGPEFGSPDALPTTLNVSFPGCRSDVLLVSLDLAGVACSTGSACSSGSLLPSPVLQAMGVPDGVLRSAIRFSLGPTLTDGDIDEAVTRIAKCVREVRQRG
ncbi:cysteine desulfurase family protein [Fimbriiglobus ruber]|uniref:Cysteine desulfurase n=1 Tax=Fimbriiglobus ruber TaxID=1908690 RepID=A0A225DVJ4_9BACT|nr:cysteine desulfurase family protein [Fimbriiglobus ruber]OWK45392.1 Cysteine desulfurase [Fimbriiglobus ruber]